MNEAGIFIASNRLAFPKHLMVVSQFENKYFGSPV
jgi:hypothetical protein